MQKFTVIKFMAVIAFSVAFQLSNAQYKMVWFDEFDGTTLDSSKWNIVSNVGIWNTGNNRELQHYTKNNVEVGSDGNGNSCLVITAKKENYKNYAFTSGRIDTRGKFSVKYGAIEARIKMPDLANGLWPAYWLLGYSKDSWPKCGEIDILEMGHKDGIAAGTPNKTISGALHWENQNANNAYAGYGKATTLNYALNDDYHVFRLEWVKGMIKMYVDGVEYYAMSTTNSDADEFNSNPFFLILNLAVGGMFPDIYTTAGITAPMPAKMYVDYIRVYQNDNDTESELHTTPHAMYGNYGVYSETGQFPFKLDIGYEGNIFTTNLSATTSAAAEGSECLAYTASGSDYSFAINAPAGLNMQNYANGSIQFQIKSDLSTPIQIGFKNKAGQKSEISIENDSPYAFVRNNTWTKINIPITEFSPAISLTEITELIAVTGTGEDGKLLAIDQVFWSEIVPSSDKYLGIFSENPNIFSHIAIDNQTVHLYIWDNSLTALTKTVAYEGEACLTFKANAGRTWYGYGIFSDIPVDLTAYKDGALHLSLKTDASNEFWFGIGGANNTEGKITFPASNGLYGFKRNGTWQELIIPMSDFTKAGLDLSGCGNIFMLGGGTISNISVDDIYFSTDKQPAVNPAINPVEPVAVTKKGNSSQMSIFPNPASNYIVIQNSLNDHSIEIHNLIGKKVLATQAFGNNSIDISRLAAGVYFVNVISNSQKNTFKIIKK